MSLRGSIFSVFFVVFFMVGQMARTARAQVPFDAGAAGVASFYGPNDGGIGPIAGVPLPPAAAPALPIPRPEWVNLRILHTNDLHSQYRPDKGGFQLGGVARLATAIRRARAEVQGDSVLVDGGDWSEGKIYYQLDGGRTALEIMNALNYDAAVIGNHDWLNGPAQLLTAIRRTPPRFALLGANLILKEPRPPGSQRAYTAARGLLEQVKPFTIVQIGPARVGIIGISTFEEIYNRYFDPIIPRWGFPYVRHLAELLKVHHGVDLVIVASHNSHQVDRLIAQMPYVDVVVHAHDHLKFSQPDIVTKPRRPGQPVETAVIVEAEKWGHYLGCLDLRLNLRSHSFNVAGYRLIQIDETIPEDPQIAPMVNNYEAELTARYLRKGDGDIFRDTIAHTDIPLGDAGGRDSVYGNLLADAYREYAHADVGFEQTNFTSGVITEGPITAVDVFNALSQVFNPVADKAWTLFTMVLPGRSLFEIIDQIFSLEAFAPGGMPSISGMHIVYDPAKRRVRSSANLAVGQHMNSRSIVSIDVGGRPLDLNRQYKLAIPQGVKESLEFLETRLRYRFQKQDETDTGMEDWRILKNYLAARSHLRAQTVAMENRFQSISPDLAIYSPDMRVQRHRTGFHLEFVVHNYGSAESSPRLLKFGYDRTPTNTIDDPNIAFDPAPIAVPAISPGGSVTLMASINVPASILAHRRIPIAVILGPVSATAMRDDLNSENDRASIVFQNPL